MTLQPMPIHVRIFPGETVDSFARRAATANHTTITDIEAGLRHYGLLISRARSSDQRACLWRQLGALPPHAFSTPKKTFNNHPVPARTLCRHCANGDTVIARMPHLGMICLRHGCTLQPPRTLRSITYPQSCTQSAASVTCTEPAVSSWTPPPP